MYLAEKTRFANRSPAIDGQFRYPTEATSSPKTSRISQSQVIYRPSPVQTITAVIIAFVQYLTINHHNNYETLLNG